MRTWRKEVRMFIEQTRRYGEGNKEVEEANRMPKSILKHKRSQVLELSWKSRSPAPKKREVHGSTLK